MKTRIRRLLILAAMVNCSSLIAGAANWTNWNKGQSIGSFYAVAGTAKETVAVGIDGRIATRNCTSGTWKTQTFGGSPGFQAIVTAILHAKNPFSHNPDFRAIIYAKNQYVVVRETGLIMTSPDGLKWTGFNSPTKNTLMGLFWDGHQYLAGGDQGTILSSADGIKWTSRSSGCQVNFYSFSCSGKRYVAVGNDGIRISSNSVAWTEPASAPTSVPFTACTWTGTEFLACGLGLDKNPTIYTSPDGDFWTLRDNTITESLRAATTINGTIYIAGDSVIKESTDGGTTWADTFTNFGDNKLFMGLAYDGHSLIAAGFNHNVFSAPTPISTP
jgi:hypothetical protein